MEKERTKKDKNKEIEISWKLINIKKLNKSSLYWYTINYYLVTINLSFKN